MSKKRNNKTRMALVPQNPMACERCLMLASREPSYTYEFNPHGHLNHNCKCKFVALRDKTRIEGHDHNEYHRRWQNVKKAREELGYSVDQMTSLYELIPIDDPLDIIVDTFVENVRKCAETIGTDEFAKVLKEAETREIGWLYRGEIPNVSYASKKLEEEILKKRSHEKETADRLSQIGVKCDFQIDSETIDGKTIGLADFSNGIEIKTIRSASSRSTIDDYIRKTNKKKDADTLIFDITDSNMFTCEEFIECVNSCRKFDGSVYVLKGAEYYRIY